MKDWKIRSLDKAKKKKTWTFPNRFLNRFGFELENFRTWLRLNRFVVVSDKAKTS